MMAARSTRLVVCLVAASSAVSIASAGHAASCFSGSQVISPDKISADEAAIKSDPAGWLAGKGASVSSAVRDLAASDPDFAATMVSQFKGKANREQSASIGSGLGQASSACRSLPDEGAKIQAAAAGSTDEILVASYGSTTGNTQTASTGGGGGGDGGGGTGVGGASGTSSATSTGGGLGTLEATTPSSTTNAFQNLLTGGTPSSPSSISATTTTTTPTTTTPGTTTTNTVGGTTIVVVQPSVTGATSVSSF